MSLGNVLPYLGGHNPLWGKDNPVSVPFQGPLPTQLPKQSYVGVPHIYNMEYQPISHPTDILMHHQYYQYLQLD